MLSICLVVVDCVLASGVVGHPPVRVPTVYLWVTAPGSDVLFCIYVVCCLHLEVNGACWFVVADMYIDMCTFMMVTICQFL
jgi:hypothetical protein